MKKYILNLSMNKKMLLTPMVAIIIISILGIMFFTGLISQRSTLNNILNVRFNIYQQSAEISTKTTAVHANIYKILNLMTSNFDQQQITKLSDEQWVALDSTIAQINALLNSNLLTDEEKTLYQDSLKNAVEYKDKAVEALTTAGYDMNTGTIMMGMCDDQYNILSDNLKKIMAMQNDLSARMGNRAKNSLAVFISVTMLFIIASLILTVFISIFITRVIVNPIKKTIAILRDISEGEGDLTRTLEVRTSDEIGELARLFNQFVLKIRNVVQKVKGTSIQLSESSEHLSSATNTFSENAQGQAASAEEITASIEEIQANISIIAQGSDEQFESVSSLITKIEMQSEIILRMDIKIEESSSLSEAMYSEARSREQSLKYMSESMININKSSKEMTNIINIIHDISDKINLLSLNAAIEAARAGDAGRGFAVVADEISKLADQTAQSLKDIGTLIKTSEDEINRGISNVNETFDTITHVITGVNSISDMMKNIKADMNSQKITNAEVISEVKIVGERSEEIKFSIDEQKSAMKEIMSSITNISDLTQNNSAEAEEMAADANNLADLANTQNKLVDFFHV